MDTRALGKVGPRVSVARPRLHGDVRSLRPRRSGGEHRHDPRRARRRRHAPRHRRLLRDGPQRAAHPRGARGRPRDAVVLSVKFGALRDARGGWIGVDGRPAAVKNFLAYTLRRLGTDHVDIYRLAPRRPGGADRGDGRRDRRDGQGRATCATSGSRRPARRRSAGRTPCTRSATCRSSTRSSRAASRTRSCPRPRARDRRDRVRRALPRPPERPLVEGPRAPAATSGA